eukprot:scaffold770_cov362-Pavlova_lutheri.AAC.13
MQPLEHHLQSIKGYTQHSINRKSSTNQTYHLGVKEVGLIFKSSSKSIKSNIQYNSSHKLAFSITMCDWRGNFG